MIAKQITVYVKPGHWDAYLASQAIWNRETRGAAGYLGGFCGQASPDEGVVHLMFFWRSREALQRWMETEHDRIAELAAADLHYERIETRILDDVSGGGAVVPGLLHENTLEAADVQFWSEAYRATAALRTALRLGLFDALSAGPLGPADLGRVVNVDAALLKHLLRAVRAMGLVEERSDGWVNSGLADRTLVRGAAAYQGDAVLHNSQPSYIDSMFAYGERLGLPAELEDEAEGFERFLHAMANTAAGGQADALVDAVDLSGCRTLLDVGGATGPYAIALCRAYPELHVEVLDQEKTMSSARGAIAEAGMENRIRVVCHDYRRGAFPRPVDAVLLSNLLRGETEAMVVDILRRAGEALVVGGRVIVQDHFPEDGASGRGLRASLFGLHLVDKANLTMREMAGAVEAAGLKVVRVERLPQSVVMNGIVEGYRES